MEIIFVGSIIIIFFAYLGYPMSLWFLGIFRKKAVKKAPYFPKVTLIVTVFNEEKRIKDKLDNTLTIEYPKDQFQILVASDGSTDQTNAIVKEYENQGIELIVTEERGGKENAQKEAVKHARGEVLVFSDVATYIEPDGLKEIIFNFADSSVGCVSSEDRVARKDGNSGGEGFYIKYEMWLRRLESKVNSLVGLSGSFFAARKEVCRDFSGKMQSDFRILLNSMRMGFRGVSDPRAIGYYQDILEEKKEFDRKVRTVLRGFTVFFSNLEFLNVFRYGFFSYQYFCHKLLRWLVPFFLCVVIIANLTLVTKSLMFFILFVFQATFYSLAILGQLKEDYSSNFLLKIPSYFVTVNASIFWAWLKYLTGQRIVMWTPSER